LLPSNIGVFLNPRLVSHSKHSFPLPIGIASRQPGTNYKCVAQFAIYEVSGSITPTYVISHLPQTSSSIAIAQFGKVLKSKLKHAFTIGLLPGR